MPTAEEVLKRIAALADARSDAALAKILGVSPTTVANWRQRNTVPYEAAATLGERQGVSLDHLIFGRGPVSRRTLERLPELLKAIVHWLEKLEVLANPSARVAAAGVIYLRIAATAKSDAEAFGLVEAEVRYIRDSLSGFGPVTEAAVMAGFANRTAETGEETQLMSPAGQRRAADEEEMAGAHKHRTSRRETQKKGGK